MGSSDRYSHRPLKEREQRCKEEEEQRLLDRLDQQLGKIYPRGQDGNFDWYSGDTETIAKVTALWLVEHPERWKHIVQRSLKYEHSWRVLELLVAELWESSWPALILGQEATERTQEGSTNSPTTPKLQWAPLFPWIIARATGNLKDRWQAGPDPGSLEWRNMCIAMTIRDIVQVGIRPATSDARVSSACRLVGDHLGMSANSILKIWMRSRRIEKRLQAQRAGVVRSDSVQGR